MAGVIGGLLGSGGAGTTLSNVLGAAVSGSLNTGLAKPDGTGVFTNMIGENPLGKGLDMMDRKGMLLGSILNSKPPSLQGPVLQQPMLPSFLRRRQ